jgi:hypothetical protein
MKSDPTSCAGRNRIESCYSSAKSQDPRKTSSEFRVQGSVIGYVPQSSASSVDELCLRTSRFPLHSRRDSSTDYADYRNATGHEYKPETESETDNAEP